MDLVPTPVSEYNKQTAARFTIRSAASPSYSLNRRPGVRRARASSGEEGENAEEVQEIETCRKQTSGDDTNKQDTSMSGYQTRTGNGSRVTARYEEKETLNNKSTNLNPDCTADRTITDFGINRSPTSNPASETRGRTRWRGYSLPSRSKSLDWRTGPRSTDRGTGSPDMDGKQGGDISEQEGKGAEVNRGRGRSSVRTYTSAANYVAQERSPTLDRVSKGQSLPFRLRSLSRPGSDSSIETAAPSEPKGGQTISERIERLLESASVRECCTPGGDWRKGNGQATNMLSQEGSRDWAAGGTFPRRCSLRENSSLSPMPSRQSFTWTPQRDTTSGLDNLLSPKGRRTRLRIPDGHWQDQNHGGGGNWGRGFVGMETRSLDRAQSRSTVAAQIRSARAARGISTPPQSNMLLEETSLSDPSGTGERRASRYNDRRTHREEKGETTQINETLRDRTVLRTERDQEERGADDGVKGAIELRGSSVDEDVFDSNPQDIRLNTGGRKACPDKLLVSSAASVRNKINQFEALTQRAQGSAAGQLQTPRRTFSVPTQLNSLHDGVKKSASAKAIGGLRDKRVGLRGIGEADRTAEGKVSGGGARWQQRGPSERSLSLDEVGLRLGNNGMDGHDSAKKEGNNMDGGNKCTNELDACSRLKHPIGTPPDSCAEQHRTNFYIDDTDFSKNPDSDNDVMAGDPASLLPSNSDSTGSVTDAEQSGGKETRPVSDDDETPTNTPNRSPFHSPDTQPERTTLFATASSDSTTFSPQAAKTPEPDPSLPLHPLAASSHHNLPELTSPHPNTDYPIGKKHVLDLDAWVAGWKPWKDNGDAYEEDDESTQKDEDSNYDSDSGESSVTITSNMSQSDRRSFCVSLSDLCNFAGGDYESENDSDEWQLAGRRSASLSSDVSALSCVSVLPSEELDRLLEDVRSLGDSSLQDSVQVVVLHKEVGVGLGFSMAGGVDQNKPVTVHKVFHIGVAAQEGSIREGDQVLSINGSALGGLSHWEALRVLRRAKTREMGVVVLRRGGGSSISQGEVQTHTHGPTQTPTTETGQRMCVRLEKNSRDLGFSLEGGAGLGNSPLTVQKIFQGGPVDRVRPGDEVVEIEGVSITGMRRLEAWALIRGLPAGPVDVVLCRPYKHLET